MAKTINSSSIVFMDLTDSRKLEVYINSNLPTTQIYNSNELTYTPDWSATSLQLNADVYLDSTEITPNSIKWYKNNGTTEVLVSSGSTLTISSNVLSSTPIIMYVCKVEHEGMTSQAQLTFTRVDAGTNGRSITIKGTAYYNGTLTAAQIGATVTLYSDTNNTPLSTSGLSNGDCYIVQGFLCVYNSSSKKFICTGTIQGPKGDDGTPAKSINLTGTSQIFKTSKSNMVTPTSITVTAQANNTSITSWTYSTDGGISFVSKLPDGVSRSGNTVTIVGANITSNSITIKASDGTISDVFTVCKTYDGADGIQGNNGAPAPIAFLTNENITFSANAQGKISATTVISNIVAYNGTTKVKPEIGTINGVPSGMTITPSTDNDEIMLTISISPDATLGLTSSTHGTVYIPIKSPVSTTLLLTWSKVNTGATGNNAPNVKAQYSANGLSNWSDTLDVTTHKYIRMSYDNGLSWNGAIKIAGDSAKNIVLNASAQAFQVSKTNAITPTTITVTAQTLNTEINSWMYSTDGGVTFSATAPSCVSRNDQVVTITGSKLTTPSITVKASDDTYFDALTVYKVFDGADGSQGVNGTSPSMVFLTNENVSFNADSNGQVATTTLRTNVVAYNGTTKVTPNIETPTDLPPGVTYSGDVVTDNERVLTFSIPNNATLGSASSNSGIITIPITSPVNTNLKLNWCKINEGGKGSDAVTFQLYAPNGYVLSSDLPTLTLQTFAYEGASAITTGATFTWYTWTDNEWVAISGETGISLSVNRVDILKSATYKCEMAYGGKVYTATATVEDKTDTYDSLIRVNAKSSANKLYWILYATVYSDAGERDALLGSIDEVEPTNPTIGDYWYKVDTNSCTVTLMKYSASGWVATTDTQELKYDWLLFKDSDNMVSLGESAKVKIVTSNDFSYTCNVQCNIFDTDYNLLSRNNQTLTDQSDPIISPTAPLNPANGQIWIKTNVNGSYIMSVWDSSLNQWVVPSADSQNKVYVAQPTSYQAGDIWIVGGDYQPTMYIDGVAQSKQYLTGTMLKAQYASSTYRDSDWVEALNYKGQIDELQNQVDVYNQFFSFDSNGVVMTARDLNGKVSDFKTKLTNTELGFYQGDDKVAHINDNTLIISKAQIKTELSVAGTNAVFKIGNFSFIQEDNGSFSITTNNV